MAQTYLSPGVYVEEVDRGTKPIEAVGTSLAAFLGITAQASLKAIDSTGARIPIETRLNKPTLVTSWTQFTDIYGDFVSGAYLPFAVYQYFANGGSSCYVTSLRALEEATGPAPELAIPAKPKGTAFKLVSLVPGKKLEVVIKAGGEDDFSMSVDGQAIQKLSLKKGENYVGDAGFKAVKITNVGTGLPEEGTYTLGEVAFQPLTVKDFIGDVSERTGLGGFEAIDEIRLVICPDIFAGYDGSQEAKERVKMVQEAMIAQCEKLRYRFAILDTPPGLNAQQAKEWRDYINFDSSYAALYYPWVQVADLSGQGSTLKLVPPSGAVAGIYNRVDADRGVHKAPANEVVLGAIDLELRLSKAEQDVLNPLGINCIRSFPARGIRVWGARTLSSNGSWRYINVRRLFIMVEASMETGLAWVVFEPNDNMLWSKVIRDVSSFLRVIWRSGALFGATPEQAFYVKCDEELNPREIRDLGQLIIEVGLSPVKPAEFVIFRISQWAGANAEG